MKNFIKYLFISLISAMTFSLPSCDYLNVNDYFEETMKYDSIFTSQRNVERYLWATAALFTDEGYIRNHPGSAFSCDEGFSLTVDFRGMQYTLGNVTPTNAQGMAKWGTMYIIIRKANTIVANLDKALDMTTLDKRNVLGYTYFMRAYAYYHLFMQYGPIVNVGDDVLENNETSDYYDRQRSTFDESVDYICSEFERAAAFLPESVPMSLFGRPTRDAALGLVARLRLIQASPLWNGGEAARKTYSTWKRSTDGVNYVSQTYDEQRWAVAAMANKRIINTGQYDLYTVARGADTYPLPTNVPSDDYPNGAGNIDPFRSYSDMFTGEALAMTNKEYVWGRMSPEATFDYVNFSFPRLNLDGLNCMCVTQKMIDNFRMVDGRTIDNSSAEYPYTTSGFITDNTSFSGYTLVNNTYNSNMVSKMYANREMRFYASIGFSGRLWTCNSTSDATKRNQVATYNIDGTAGYQASNNYPLNYAITGYVLTKFIHGDDALSGENARKISKSYPMIRYAEILLSYVEALNNLTTSYNLTDASGQSYTLSRDVDEMKKYFNMVRFRAGLPGLTDAELASRETMQTLIERERMIELLFENLRYYDVRRWGKYEESESEPIMGMNTDGNMANYFQIVPVNHSYARNRVIDKKLILFPLELDEVRKASKLDQNPGYQD